MKIEKVELFLCRLPLVHFFETSFGRSYDRTFVLVRVEADGHEGWGESVAEANPYYSSETTETVWHIIAGFLAPLVIGRTFGHPREVFPALRRVRGHNMAKAGVEMALWDLLAQRAGQSLQAFMGGQGDRVKVGVSVGIQATTGKLLDVVAGYLQEGYQRIKLKIKPGRDVGDTTAVRQAHPSLLLQVDGNSVYRLSDADHLKQLDELDLLLIEQPLAHDDIFDHAKLQPMLKTAICLDESITSVEHARWALEMKACRVINIKPARVSGLHEAIRIHDYCLERQVPVWMGGMLETGIGRASNVALASLPGFRYPGDISASARYFHEDIIQEPFVLNSDSTLSVPARPGLGVSVNLPALEKVTLHLQSYRRP